MLRQSVLEVYSRGDAVMISGGQCLAFDYKHGSFDFHIHIQLI